MKSRIGTALLALFAGLLLTVAAGCSSDADPNNPNLAGSWPDGSRMNRPGGGPGSDWLGEDNSPWGSGADSNSLGNPDDWEFFPDRLGFPNIYYAFDSEALAGQEMQKLDVIANYMSSNPEIVLSIDGHCDERGTEEYNRSLGERRALAVQNYLADRGVAYERTRTISYGKDRPAVMGSGESVWAQNRRSELRPALPRGR